MYVCYIKNTAAFVILDHIIEVTRHKFEAATKGNITKKFLHFKVIIYGGINILVFWMLLDSAYWKWKNLLKIMWLKLSKACGVRCKRKGVNQETSTGSKKW